MATDTAPAIGQRTEALALRYLGDQGLQLLERNFRCRRGEIDLVMEDGSCIVFVEVRYRRSTRFGTPAETIGPKKRRRLLIAARVYLQSHPETRRRPARFDVIAIAPGKSGLEITWIKNAIEE